jgi:DsbC/DsbD-like thiol-disulfide interchange protein
MTFHTPPYRATIATVAIIVASGITTAKAQDASPWTNELHAAARLIAGAARKAGGTVWLRAGVEIRLDPGWHTYWRSPGDSGVPPTFDFAGSGNVKSVNVLWPAPKRFPDGAGGHFNGYVGDVVFPLRIAAKDAAKPASLNLKLTYAYCKNICFPAEADLALRLSGKGGAEEQALVAAEARVPRRVALGGGGTALAVRSVRRKFIDGRQRIVVDVAAPGGTPIDLFVEGPTPGWALPPPERVNPTPGSESGAQQFSVDLDGLPPDTHVDGSAFTFTAVSPDDAVEVTASFD